MSAADDDDSTVKFTEFAPLSPIPDEQESHASLSSFIGKMFKKKDDKSESSPKQSPSLITVASDPALQSAASSSSLSTVTIRPDSPSLSSVASSSPQPSASHPKPLPFLLGQRLNKLLSPSPSPSTLKDYNREYGKYWMPDKYSKECYSCQEKFTTFKRRHHCRICYQIFCSRCCNEEIPGRVLGCAGDLRVCSSCCKAVVEFSKLSGRGAESSLALVKENLNRKTSLESVISSESCVASTPDDAGDPLSVLPPEPVSRTHKQSLASNPPDLPKISVSRSQTKSEPDKDSSSVSFAELATEDPLQTSSVAQSSDELESDEPDWVRTILNTSSFVNLTHSAEPCRERASSLSEHPPLMTSSPLRPSTRRQDMGPLYSVPSLNQPPTPSFDVRSSAEPRAREEILHESSFGEPDYLQQLFDAHGKDCLRYCLFRERLGLSWFHVLWQLARQLAYTIKPSVLSREDFDILSLVHVKTLTNAAMPAASVIFGTVCSKTVADVRMEEERKTATVLIIGEKPGGDGTESSIVYERDGQKLTSLEPVLRQEEEYLKNVVRKIAALKPNIVVVQNQVARLAQDYFRRAGITLVYNVKRSVLMRIARSTDAVPTSLKTLDMQPPRLGKCSFRSERVKLLSGAEKTLMHFEIQEPNRFATVVLSGRRKEELLRAKRVLRRTLRGVYSARMETELLRLRNVCGEFVRGIRNREQEREALFGKDGSEIRCLICAQHYQLSPLANSSSSKLAGAVCRIPLDFSPFIQITLPFLESRGSDSLMRHLYAFDPEAVPAGALQECLFEDRDQGGSEEEEPIARKEGRHEFESLRIVKPASDVSVRRELAKYRRESAKLFRERVLEDQRLRELREERRRKKMKSSSSRKDVLDPYWHDRLVISHASFSSESSSLQSRFCVLAERLVYDYYGRRDLSLGAFLNEFCFDSNKLCARCDERVCEHVRRFVHGFECVEVDVRTLPGGDSSSSLGIVSWEWCPENRANTQEKRVSVDILRLSLMRFLCYLFDCRFLRSHVGGRECERECLFHAHTMNFACQSTVASFRVLPITVSEVVYPKREVLVEEEGEVPSKEYLMSQQRQILLSATSVFNLMLEQVVSARALPEAVQAPGRSSLLSLTLNDLSQAHESNQLLVRSSLGSAQDFIALEEFSSADLRVVEGRFASARSAIALAVQRWNLAVGEFVREGKKGRKEEWKTNQSVISAGVLQEEELQASEEPSREVLLNEEEELSSTAMADSALSSIVTTSPSSTQLSSDQSDSQPRKDPSLKFSSSFSSIFTALPSPFASNFHFALPPSDTLPLGVNEHEVSSIIAYALASSDYKEQLQSLREQMAREGTAVSLKSSVFGSSQAKIHTTASGARIEQAEAASKAPEHLELEFGDASTRFYCKIYFAEHFRILRKLIFPQGELEFARSLAHSIVWRPHGGKSGMNFFKTSDDRFVLKQLSRYELASFLKLAPAYFHYVATACTERRLTALAKIFAVYRVGFRNQTSGAASKFDVLVMENLMYGRDGGAGAGAGAGAVRQVFDLKGSIRNRLAAETAASLAASAVACSDDLVLLDENLLNRLQTSPFYLHEHSKSTLRETLRRDTEFLVANLVMDYSLLVGVDEEKKQFVVGIIDYLRTFTWDKRLESFVKAAVAGPAPTVLSPDMYRGRFLEAMERYFVGVPDRWSGSERVGEET